MVNAEDPQGQLSLPGLDSAPVPARRAPTSARQSAAPVEVAGELPIAQVALDVTPAHLDRVFDYLVPAAMAEEAQPGVRVRVRFAGQDVQGFLLDRRPRSEHPGQLLPLRRVVSPERVLTRDVAKLARAVADYYAGTLSDVLRLAIPPRHARTEAAAARPAEPVDSAGALGRSVWADYRGGAALLGHIAGGRSPRAVWTALPGIATDGPGEVPHWTQAIAEAARTAAQAGRGALVVLPDARDVARVCHALDVLGLATRTAREHGPVARLTADDGPAARYRAFLAALRGEASIVVGTRAAAFAPVMDLGLVVCWNDGEDTLTEPRAPYPHVREVLAIRSEQAGCAYLLGSHGCTVAAQALVESGWARAVAAPREVLRSRAPRVRALTSTELAAEGPAAGARIPSAAWRAAREALAHGPVLIQVPRAGYVPVVACAHCRAVVRCTTCSGPLALKGAGATPQCSWCGALAGGWSCPECHGHQVRSVRVGTDRTAEELGRAFPNTAVRVSGARAADGVIDAVSAKPALVVATPGAEPVAVGGYATALLLDAAVSTAGVGLAVATEALHRWLSAAALVRPASVGGQVLLVGNAAPMPTNALVRWDPAGLAGRELAERIELGLPPAVRVAAITGDRIAVDAVTTRVPLATSATVLGPTELVDTGRQDTLAPVVRVVIRVPRDHGRLLAQQLAASMAVRSARRESGTVRVQLDPKEML